MRFLLSILLTVSVLFFCSKKTDNDTLATIGGKSVDREQFESFRKVMRMYPAGMNQYFPGQRSQITFMLETEAVFSKIKRSFPKKSILSSNDWKWKKRYYPAQVYVTEILVQNLGATEKEIENYYQTNKESFKKTVTDSTGKDSTYYEDLSFVKGNIIEKIFLQKYKPDSLFLSRFGDSLPDQSEIDREWLYTVRSNVSAFFMKKLYEESYGSNYPDSLDDFFGEGKEITPEDLDVITSWLPEERVSYYDNPHGKKELVEWLLKWKLFSQQAEKTGLVSTPEMKSMMKWAWKLEVVNRYVEEKLVPVAKSMAKIDSSMVIYALYDDYSTTEPDTQAFSRKMTKLLETQVGNLLDSMIFQIRSKASIQFTQNDLRDEKDKDPAALLRKADSLRDTGSVDEAERIYNTLSNEFSFVMEGRRAFGELAKLQMEKQLYSLAISNYRKYLLMGADESKKCNTFFMIGFIYDEYLDKPDLAEANYKWVLKNAPDCELADDAEFMMLHLDEPMSSVEELQAEALRQGRKVEPFEEDSPEATTELSEKI
ncbi:MAG TPA: hypothetical protein PLE24_11520 [Chitinispirillaceae bacterium]|nr:hypothetical protein [Chitinispirillaceae bacterium]